MEIKNRSLRSFEGAMKHCSIFGLGGHGRVVIDAAETQKIRCFGFDDNFQKIELLTKNIAIGGNYDDFVKSKNRIVAIGDNQIRKKLVTKDRIYDDFSVVHISARVSHSSILKEGCMVLAAAVLNANCKIGRSTIINTNAVVEHDCQIGDFVHLAPGCILCGSVTVSDEVFIGAGAIINPGIKIGRGAIIGAGSVIINDVYDNQTIVGNPGRVLR